jgi:hypothetical protein
MHGAWILSQERHAFPQQLLLLFLLQISNALSLPLELRLLFTGRRLISAWSFYFYLSLRLLEGDFLWFGARLYCLFCCLLEGAI